MPAPVRRSLAALVLAACAGLTACTSPGPAPGPAQNASPAPAVSTTPAPPPKQRLVVHAVGDVNLDPDYIPALRSRGYDHAWSGLDGLFATDDLTIVNLECPVSDRGTIVPKTFNFRCDPAALPAARAAGVEVANLANNHVLDYGPAALLDSLDRLRANGIAPVGAGADLAAANEPAILRIGGWTVAVLGFGGVVPAADWLATASRPGMASGDDTDAMVAAVTAAAARADLVFVTVHWGTELDTSPRPDDVRRAEAMVAAGADAIFGHHSHRLNPLDVVGGRPVAWGLGNFVWPKLSEASSRTAVARVVVEPDGSVRGCLLPASIVSPGHPQLTGARSC